ncbi:response regulator [Sphingobacterium bovistauri]|uniref:Response regulator n=1 Tax=Sphingobacterium bovistauri TaxID=2781959 RepID=A0ABS7Z537_9SPHI|nr:response regulator [Sphingobacterium bovistauri]MCA5005310.1 response regulator [Sphingobacterium bovistauri]
MRVTLVEDNAIFCFLFEKFLEDYPSKKIEIQLFSDGKKAWDHFVSIKNEPNLFPDILFLDINMPIMNGWELLENLLVNDFDFIRENPIYIVSSSKSSLDTSKCEEYSFITDYITKPIQREGIYKILDEYLNQKLNP